MQAMAWGQLFASGGGTASLQINLPPGYYVIADAALTQIDDTSSAIIGITSYTEADGNQVYPSWPNWDVSIWEQGISSVTFGLYAFGAYATGIANVFCW